MERPACIGPCVFRIVEVVCASLDTRNHANTPIIAAEFKRSGWVKLRLSNALHNCNESNGTALSRDYIHHRRWIVIRLYKQRSILKCEMSFRAPRRVCFDGNEGMIRPGLYPPRPGMRINNNPLVWSSVPYPSRDCVYSFSSTFRRWRNMGELDRRSGIG